jgi:hypothetical protein
LFLFALFKEMSDDRGVSEGLPSSRESNSEIDEIEDFAREAMFYRDVETRMGTFALLSAAQHVLDSISSGSDIDRERLGVMLGVANAEPKTYVRFEEDGTMVYIEDGVEVSREAPSAVYIAHQQALEMSRQNVSDFLTAKVPRYIEALDAELQGNNGERASLEIKVYRGTRHEGISIN